MQTQELKGNGRIRIARTEIDVPYLEGIVTFVTPLQGPDYYQKVMGKIDSEGLLRPTTAQEFSLVDLAMQNEDERNCAELLKRFRENYLWTCTESLSFPKGVLVYDNIKGDIPADSKKLMKMLESGDKRVRFAEKGFKTGDIPISEFLKHPYLIAQVGEEMLPVVERVAKNINKKTAWIYAIDSASQDTKRVSALDVYGGGLDVGGGCHVDCGDWDGCAFGVVDTGEVSSRKKSRK